MINTTVETKADASSAPTATFARPPPPHYADARLSCHSTAPLSMYPSYPAMVSYMRAPHPGVLINPGFIPVQSAFVRDYLPWSIVNIFMGGVFLGVVAVLLSLQTRMRREAGDILGARQMSKITLLFNVFTTVVSFVAIAFVIIYFVYCFSDPN